MFIESLKQQAYNRKSPDSYRNQQISLCHKNYFPFTLTVNIMFLEDLEIKKQLQINTVQEKGIYL